MASERNALAELAEQVMRERNALAFYRSEYSPVLDKAHRIIAELAKVGDEGEYQGSYDYKISCRNAYEECRAIAGEGA